jgi:glycosyltransferase involved in cell wall biosynthesis
MKLALVVQRYGADIAGGSEAHCREVARRLAASHTVTVLTTCARDYVTWQNAYPAGEDTDGSVRVLRFAVRQPRRMSTFADLSDQVFDGGAAPERQVAWFRENGPDAPELLEHLRTQGAEYDLVLFWTFRYAPSFFGLPHVADRSILVPTAEDDAAIHLDAAEEFFQRPAGYLFLTPEEETLVSMRAGRPLRPSAVIGIGLDPPPERGDRSSLSSLGVPHDFVLYLGRIDRNKGCHTLLDYFVEYAERSTVTLVLAGPAKLQIPAHPRIRALGYVSDAIRESLLAEARALIVPSPYESLSIVLLEAWNHGIPALVNAECRVLEGQVRRANGGLHYRSAAEFGEALDTLLGDDALRAAMGRQGREYVDREYRWPVVLDRIEHVLEDVAGRRTGGPVTDVRMSKAHTAG